MRLHFHEHFDLCFVCVLCVCSHESARLKGRFVYSNFGVERDSQPRFV